jgi:hypothetical protein
MWPEIWYVYVAPLNRMGEGSSGWMKSTRMDICGEKSHERGFCIPLLVGYIYTIICRMIYIYIPLGFQLILLVGFRWPIHSIRISKFAKILGTFLKDRDEEEEWRFTWDLNGFHRF